MIGLLAWCSRQAVPAAFDSALAAMCEDGSWLVRSESVSCGRVGAVGPRHSLRRMTDPGGGAVLWVDGIPCEWDGRELSEGAVFRTGVESCAGHFAAILHRPGHEGLQAVTDPWGPRLLYQVRIEKGWLLVSDLHAVFAAGLVPRRVDPAYVRTLLRFNKCRLGDRTLLCDVEVLPPASVVRFFPDGRREVTSLRLPEVQEESRTEAEWVDRLAPLMRSSVSRSLSRFPRPALALSGGLDSRMLLAAMTPEQRRGTVLLTTGNPRSDEVRLAEETARVAGCRCDVVPLGAEDFIRGEDESRRCNEEFDIFVQGAAGFLHRRAAEVSDALMTGWDVDVELRGTYTSSATAAMRTEEDVRARIERKWGLCSSGELQALLRPEFQADTPDPTPDLLDDCLRTAAGSTPEATYLRFIQMYEKRRLLMLRARMIRRRIETLLPFYDPELQLAMRAVPEEMKRGNRLFRALLIALDPALAAVPYQRTLRPALAPPEEWEAGAMAEAEKEATLRRAWMAHRSGVFCERHFSNFDEWLLADPHWDAAVCGLLLDGESALLRDVVRPEAVKAWVDEHRSGARNHMSRLVYLMSLASYWNV